MPNEYSVKIFLGESKPKPLDKMNKDTEALADIVKQPKKTPTMLHTLGSETTVTTDVFDLKIGVTGNNPNASADNFVTVGTNSGYGINIKNFWNGNQLCAIELDDLYFNVYGENQKNILKAELNGESFTIGAFKFTFNTDGVYIYNTVKRRGISIAYTT